MTKNPCTVAIVKRTAWRTENQDTWPCMGQSVADGLFLKQGGNIECTITRARHDSSDLPQGRLQVPCTLGFSSYTKVRKVLIT